MIQYSTDRGDRHSGRRRIETWEIVLVKFDSELWELQILKGQIELGWKPALRVDFKLPCLILSYTSCEVARLIRFE